MAHGTRINGTAYGISGGKCLIGGTAYDIKKGRTMIGGTGYDINLNPFDPVFGNNTWEQIALASQAGVAESIWSVGDTKEVTLSGEVNSRDFSGTYYCYILGFNHNAALEGDNRIHIQFGKKLDGTELCFGDLAMNRRESALAVGGWRDSDMRNIYLGTDPTSCAGTFLATLPQDLLAQLRPTQKYTDNGTRFATAMSATTDYVWLPSEKEVCGSISIGNAAEGDYQQQYAYYAAGASLLKYIFYRNSTNDWWLRSRSKGGTSYYYFSYISDRTLVDREYPYETKGFTPIFCV